MLNVYMGIIQFRIVGSPDIPLVICCIEGLSCGRDIIEFHHHGTWKWTHRGLAPYNKYGLTHWGRVTHICVSKLTIIGSDNGLSPGRRQAIIWTYAGILLIKPGEQMSMK